MSPGKGVVSAPLYKNLTLYLYEYVNELSFGYLLTSYNTYFVLASFFSSVLRGGYLVWFGCLCDEEETKTGSNEPGEYVLYLPLLLGQ